MGNSARAVMERQRHPQSYPQILWTMLQTHDTPRVYPDSIVELARFAYYVRPVFGSSATSFRNGEYFGVAPQPSH